MPKKALSRRKEQIDLSRLWWLGGPIIIASIVVNYFISRTVLILYPRMKLELDSIIFLTAFGALGAILVFALIGWLTPHLLKWYNSIAAVTLLLSFIPDILLFRSGFSSFFVTQVGAYMLMNICTAVICVFGLTELTRKRAHAI